MFHIILDLILEFIFDFLFDFPFDFLFELVFKIAFMFNFQPYSMEVPHSALEHALGGFIFYAYFILYIKRKCLH